MPIPGRGQTWGSGSLLVPLPAREPRGRSNSVSLLSASGAFGHRVVCFNEGERQASRHSGCLPWATECNPTHLSATASSGFCCLSVSANKRFSLWQSKPSFSTPVAIEFLNPGNLQLILFLQNKRPLPLLQENSDIWNYFKFCQHSISFSSLQPEGMICNVHLKSSDQGRRLKWLIKQRCKKRISIAYLK